ncbi:MAG TPA: AMP-binding protein, partial [Burkholderiaceae bacterium]|nr:AMP-binding protein [Burkholderiaceae bacterium]
SGAAPPRPADRAARCGAELLERVREAAAHAPRDEHGRPTTLIAALARNAVEEDARIAVRERDRGIWREYRWSEVLADVLALAVALEQGGLREGAALLVIGDNRLRLYEAMLAAMVLGAFPAPVYSEVPPGELHQYSLLGHPDVAIAEDQEQVDKLLALRAQTGGRPATILYADPRGLRGYPDAGLASLEEALERGRERLLRDPASIRSLIERARPGDYAVLLHSSGTTGVPKGVPLTHANLLGGVRNAERGGCFARHESHYAYLPMAWVGDFVFTLGAGIELVFSIHIPERQETVPHDLREVAPTMYLAAPRAWDQMLTRVQVGIAEATPFKRALHDRFMAHAVAIERGRLAGRAPTAAQRLVRRLGEWLVFAPIKDALGLSRAERAYTGGEALGEDTFVAFRAMGVNLKQFYGQTETSALTAVQRDDGVKLHTVGRPLPGVEVRIGDDGEILLRSASVFPGYHDNPQATAQALRDGWLATGDAGYLEPDGDLVVLGRVSEVVHTAAGERFVPNYIENRLKFSPYVRNAAIVGAGRPFLVAMLCIDFESVGHWAERRGLSYTSYAELSQLPQVLDLLSDAVVHINTMLKPELRVHRFASLPKDFDADDGEITRTRKLRRNVIEQRYADLVEALFADMPGPSAAIELASAITYESGETGTLRRSLTLRKVP